MEKQIDLEKLAREIDDYDLDSIKEELKNLIKYFYNLDLLNMMMNFLENLVSYLMRKIVLMI